MSTPRILHLSVTAGQDPTGKIALQLARDSISRGFDVHIAYGRGNVPDDIPATRIANAADLIIHGAVTRLLDRHASLNTPSLRRLRNLLDRFSPDIVHLHNIHGYYIGLPGLCHELTERNIPAVMTLHDLWPLTGHCATPEECRAYTSGCCTACPHSAAYPSAISKSRTAKNFQMKAEAFDTIERLWLVAPSQHILKAIGESHLNRRPTTLISNGIDTDTYTPGTEPKEPFILAVSRKWNQAKGLYDLMELRKQLPSTYTIKAAGRVSHSISRRSGIEFIGECSKEQLIQLYRRASVTVIPSHGESFSLVKAESLACGTPVACYDAGATGEHLALPCGVSVTPGDISALSRGIQQLISHQPSAESCRSLACRLYKLEQMLDNYHKLYSKILQE